MIKATASAGALVVAAVMSASTFANNETVTDFEVITAPAMKAAKAPKTVLTEVTKTANATIAVGDYGVVLYRDANADSWQQADVPTSVLFTSVDFIDDQHGWAAGHHGVIAATSDGGRTWQMQLDGFQFIDLQISHFQQLVETLEAQQEALDGTDADVEDALSVALDNALFLLDTAQFAKEDGPTKPFLDIRAISRDLILAVGAYGTLVRSQDGGTTWQVLDERVDNPDGFHLNALASDGEFVYIAGEAGQLFRSADQGDTWDVLDSPYYGSLFGLHVDAQQQLWVVGLRGNIFVSSDQGESYRQISLDDAVNINSIVDAPQGGVYLVGNAGVIGWVNTAGEVKQMTHASGAALTDLVAHDDGRLTVVGQRGIIEITDFVSESTSQTQE